MDAQTDDERIRQHADLVYRTCLRITGNVQDAADVAQEVFVAWLRNHREIRGSVAAWLHGTARQRSLDWLRTRHRRDRHEQQAGAPTAAESMDGDWRVHLDEALEELPTPVRTLVVEHHLLGLTQGQLATRHRCTQATISRRLTQALDLLRSALRSRGVTASGTVLITALTAARATACPMPLVAPVQAQAQLVGATALIGPAVIGGIGLLGWSAVAVGVLMMIMLLGGAGLWWWAAQIEQEIDRDWTAVATAHLPPLPDSRSAVALPTASPRYPSIEELIARQAPLNALRQGRLAELIAPGGQEPWSSVDDRSLTVLASVTGKLKTGEALKAEEAKALARVSERLRPILDELHHADVALGAGAFLAQAYIHGRLAGSEQRAAWLAGRLGGVRAIGQQSGARTIAALLMHVVLQAPDPRAALADLDVWVTANSRAAITIMEALISQALWEMRDDFYQELAWRGRLPADVQQQWLAERCPTAQVISDAIMGEALLMLIPHLEDLRAGRAADQGVFEYAAFGPSLTWIPRHLDIIQGALTGQEAERFRRLNEQVQAGEGSLYWPSIKYQAGLVPLSETRHRARRLAVEILQRARAGEALPESLATDITRGANSWGLRYERQSATRFALIVDPDGGLPVCGLPEEIGALRSQIQEVRSKPRTKPLVNHRLMIEMEVPSPSATDPVVLPSEPQPSEEILPPFQSLAQ